MASISRLKARSSAEQVEWIDELITNILSRFSTKDVLKMSTVRKRWRTLIFEPGFVYTHHENCHKESICCFSDREKEPTPEQFQFRSFNSQTGNISIVPFSLEGLDSSFLNGSFEIVTVSNGLICFHPHDFVDIRVFWVYNPVTKFLRKLPTPFEVDIEAVYFGEICYTQNTQKFVMICSSIGEEQPCTLVFDSRLNSWYRGQQLPILRFINIYQYSSLGNQVFFNGVIYFIVGVEIKDAKELEGFKDLEGLREDGDDILQTIIGYDVNQDQWGFYLFVPASVGCIFCLIEWEGNILVCASEYADGLFVFWILDTEHKRLISERELDLRHELHTSWEVSASSGVVWFTCGYNSLIVYHMKNRQWSRHRIDDTFDLQHPRDLTFVTFEPTLLSF